MFITTATRRLARTALVTGAVLTAVVPAAAQAKTHHHAPPKPATREATFVVGPTSSYPVSSFLGCSRPSLTGGRYYSHCDTAYWDSQQMYNHTDKVYWQWTGSRWVYHATLRVWFDGSSRWV